jgi:hypothetical protein
MGVCPPAVRGRYRRGVGQQLLGVFLMAAWLDREVGVAGIEHSPQRATLPGSAPARLVHVQRPGGAQPAEKIIVGVGQRRRGPGEDRVHRARADPGAEQLFDELDSVTAGDAVADRQRRYRRFKARPERAASHLLGQCGARAPAALRVVHSLSTILAHLDVDRR